MWVIYYNSRLWFFQKKSTGKGRLPLYLRLLYGAQGTVSRFGETNWNTCSKGIFGIDFTSLPIFRIQLGSKHNLLVLVHVQNESHNFERISSEKQQRVQAKIKTTIHSKNYFLNHIVSLKLARIRWNGPRRGRAERGEIIPHSRTMDHSLFSSFPNIKSPVEVDKLVDVFSA